MNAEDIEKQVLSVKFIRYAQKKLTNNRADKNHKPSFESFLLRVPNSINSKYEGQVQRAKVKIVQRWNGIRAKPTEQFMLSDFKAHLIQELLDESVKQLEVERERKEKEKWNKNQFQQRQSSTTIALIEKLLETPIEDYRKHARDLIIIPYLVVCKQLSDRNQIYDIVMKWADRCAELKRLEPSRREFSIRVRKRIDEVLKDRIPPMTFDTLREKNPELYEKFGAQSS